VPGMNFFRKLLGPGEETVLETRPHWSLLVPRALVLALVFAGSIAVVVLWSKAPGWIGSLLLVVGLVTLGWFLLKLLAWRSARLIVTTRRVVYRSGILQRVGREIPLNRIQDITYHQTLLQRVLGAGSLTIESAGEGGSEPFPDIRRPARVQSVVSQLMSQPPPQPGRAVPRQPAGAPSAQVAAAGSPSIIQQIEELAHLHRAGVLTDAEFEAKKTDLLGRL
jgi:membrane protein YdbS with pleckstrin-like domain